MLIRHRPTRTHADKQRFKAKELEAESSRLKAERIIHRKNAKFTEKLDARYWKTGVKN